MNLTPFEITEAVGRLTALSMFPTNPAAHTEIMRLIDRMVGTREQLDWLVGAMIDQVGAWHGTAELRAVFCTRFKPKDGVEASSALPGFTAADSEAKYVQALLDAPQRVLRGPNDTSVGDLSSSVKHLAKMKRLVQ